MRGFAATRAKRRLRALPPPPAPRPGSPVSRRDQIDDLEVLHFTTWDGERRCCPHFNSFGGGLRTCKRRDCTRCGRGWARSWEAVLRTNLIEYGGEVALVTITAPGADRLPWNCERKHKHSGALGCKVKDDFADVWSDGARKMWPLLRGAARKACAAAGWKPFLIVRAWEPQKRGVPHLHLVLGMGTEPERIATRRFVDELALRAEDYGFGFVDRHIQPISAREASNYLAGYLLGRSSHKEGIRKNISDPRMPRSLVWLTPELTKRTLATMRRLRYVRWYFAALHGRCGISPQLRGQSLVDVARVACLLEPKRARAPGEGDDDRFRRHFRNLVQMRSTSPLAVAA